MAEAVGVKLGPLLAMSESNRGGMPQPAIMRNDHIEMSDAIIPISAGEQTLSVSANLSYGIVEWRRRQLENSEIEHRTDTANAKTE